MAGKERYDRSDIRRLNAVSVLNVLRVNGAMSRAGIAGRLGLTRATVSSIVTDLIDNSLVTQTEHVKGAAGRPGLLVGLNPNCGCMIGVEIDLDCISIVLANMGRDIIWREDVPLAVDSSPSGALAIAVDLVERAIAAGEEKKLGCLGVCVAWAGLVDHQEGELSYGPISGWERVSLKSDWEARFGVPVFVENEANAGAIGAHHFGAKQGVANLIYLSLGVGLAAGVFADGALLRGKRGFAGQVGHMHFCDNEITCGCGKTGCWVTEVGASAVLRKMAAEGVDVPVESGDNSDWLDWVVEEANSENAGVIKVLNGVGRQIGEGLARLVQTFDPSALVVGGRLGKLMLLVEPKVRETLLAGTLPHLAESLELTFSSSSEDQLMGCLATVFDAVMKNPPIGSD